MKGFTLFNKATSTGCKMTDKQKLFVILVQMFGPIPAKSRADRMGIAEELECSERTVFRVLSGVKGSVEIDFDNKSKAYKLSNSRRSLLELIKDLGLPLDKITDESLKDARRQGQAETMRLDANLLEVEDHHAPLNCPREFGKGPKDILPPCLVCPIDEDCLAATKNSA